ncbi:hypothetical protein X798_02572 [Onchocerca flexuosa]|uniref:Uncharacterized protein n=1 Tax=Onchocerca flexuosa TaxID=387005 RepID=A0A238BZL9_9BILA|nr:hypothetical protein X798_02572 [Onchocerca flexuosa]
MCKINSSPSFLSPLNNFVTAPQCTVSKPRYIAQTINSQDSSHEFERNGHFEHGLKSRLWLFYICCFIDSASQLHIWAMD